MTRKILCLILSLSMILSLAACGKQSEKPVAADPGESVPEPLETSLPVSPLPEEEKTVITLATAYMDGPLYTMIRQFNEQRKGKVLKSLRTIRYCACFLEYDLKGSLIF